MRQAVLAEWSKPDRLYPPAGSTLGAFQRKDRGSNLVICNPPYVRHHHRAAKTRLLAATAAASGIQMAGLAGLYCYFLGLAHAWMEPDGIAGWLIPSEFMDVNYACR